MHERGMAKVWAMVLVIMLVASVFVEYSIVASAPTKDSNLRMIDSDSPKKPLNINGLKSNDDKITPLSLPPQNDVLETWSHNFDSDTVDLWPSIPPWNYGNIEAGQAVSFTTDDFEDDILGLNPDSPPWRTTDGLTPVLYWDEDFNGFTLGQDLTGGAVTGDFGYFGNFGGGATLVADTPPAGSPPGTIIPGYTTGLLCADYMCPGNSYWGPYGIGDDGSVTHAFAGGWVYMNALARFDILIYDYVAGATAIEVAWQNDGTLRHWPGGAYTQVAGVTWTTGTWHEMFVEYWETTRTYRIYWDGVPRTAAVSWMAGTTNIDSLIWYGSSGVDCSVDNFFHMDAPSGTADEVSVSNAQFHSGAQSVYIDQNAVAAPNLAMTAAEFSAPMSGTGSCDYWLRTDSALADTNGAIAEIIDQTEGGAIQIRANAGQFEYNNGGAWTNAMAFATDTWYHFIIDFDTVAKTYTLTIDAMPYPVAAFARQSGTLVGVRFGGTAGTQSEHYIDEVSASCAGADTNISVSNIVSHSAPNSLRFQEYNSIDYGYIGADNLGLRAGAVGTFSFWFYNTENGGGQELYLRETNGGADLTLISLGINLATLRANPGVVQLVNNDGAGFWVVDGPTYNANEWHQIAIVYNCEDMSVSGNTGSYYYSWDGGALQGPYGMMEPAAFLGMFICYGGAPDTYGDFFYDDFDLSMSASPGAPTNCWAKIPDPTGSETWNNYTTDQDNPVHGIVTGTETNTHDAGTEDLQEVAINDVPTWANNTPNQDVPNHGSVINSYTNIDEIYPSDTLTEEIIEVVGAGGQTYMNYSTDMDIPWEGTVTGTEANTHGPGTEDIQETLFGGDTWINYTTQADVGPGHGTVTGTEADTHTIDAATQDIQEVTALKQTIVINEFSTGADWAELHNYGTTAQNMTGWTWYWHDERGYAGTWTIPYSALHTIPANGTVVIQENAGVDNATTWFLGSNMMWDATSGGIAGEIRDPSGQGIDFFKTGTDSTNPRAPSNWVGASIAHPVPGDLASRDDDDDTDTTNDWVTGGSPTWALLNPGQIGTTITIYSLEKRWETQSILTNATAITVFVTARTNTGSDDTFTIWCSADNVIFTQTTIVINSDIMTTYSAAIPPSLNGTIYFRMIDENNYDTAGQDSVYIDAIRIEYWWNNPFWHMARHKWRTESILVNADNLTLYVTACTNTGSDDTFTFYFSTDVNGTFTATSIVVNSDVMTTYSAALPVLSGQLYILMEDDNRADPLLADTIYIDTIRLERAVGMSLEHRWRTDSINLNTIRLELYVTARTNTGSDDSFTFGYAVAENGPYTSTTIVVNSDIMTTYSMYLPVMTGQIYLSVMDDATWDFSQQDSIIIDTIRLETTISGATVSNSVATADNPIEGTVTGTYVLTTSIPPDNNPQQISEVMPTTKLSTQKPCSPPITIPEASDCDDDAQCYGPINAFSSSGRISTADAKSIQSGYGLTSLSPGPQPMPSTTVMSEDFSAPWVPCVTGKLAPPGWIVDGICVAGQAAGSPLTHYWSQFDDAITGFPTSNSTPTSAGLWWSNGFGETVGTRQNETLISPTLDLSLFQNVNLTFAAAYTMPSYGAGANEHNWVNISTNGPGGPWTTVGCLCHDAQFEYAGCTGGPGGPGWNWFDVPVRIDLSAYDKQPSVTIMWHCDYSGVGNRGIWCVDDVHIDAEYAGYSIEHTWTMETLPTDSTTRSLFITARTNTGSNDEFTFGWSQNPSGPFTPVITVSSDVYSTYNAPLPTAISGPIYINVKDSNGEDWSQIDTLFVDSMYIFNDNTIWPEYSLEHRWRTQSIAMGAQTLNLHITAMTSTGADDTFTFGYSQVLGSNYTMTSIVVDSDVMTTYTTAIPYWLSGPLYLNVIDNNSDWGHFSALSIDTLYVDDIVIEYFSPGGTLVQEIVVGDRPAHGVVSGTYALTTSIPPDGLEQEITEIDILTTGETNPSPFSPEPGPSTQTTVLSEDFSTPWVLDPDGDYLAPPGWDVDGVCVGNNGGSLTHYWSQFDDVAVGFSTSNSTPYCAGAWWSNGAGETVGTVQDEWIKTPILDLSTSMNTKLYFNMIYFFDNDAGEDIWLKVSPNGGTSWDTIGCMPHDFLIPGATGGWLGAGWCDYEMYDPTAVIPLPVDLSAYDFLPAVQVAWHINYAGAGNRGIVCLDDVHIEAEPAGYSLEHRWRMNLQSNALTRALRVNAHINVGTNDNFTFGWSPNLDGPYTPLFTVNSSTAMNYTGQVPIIYNGEFYVRVIDANPGDNGGPADTVFVDMVYMESFISAGSNSVDIRWNLSVDDYGGIWYTNYTVDQDNPVEGTVTNTYTDVDEISPPDGLTEDIQESGLGVDDTWQNYTAASDIDVRGSRTGMYTNIDEINPPDGLTENIQEETAAGLDSWQNYTAVSDIDVIGARTGTYTNIDEIDPPDGLTENIQEIASNVYTNWTVGSDIDVEGTRVGTYLNIDEIDPPDGLFESITEAGSVVGYSNVSLINNESFETWPPTGWTITGNWAQDLTHAQSGTYSAYGAGAGGASDNGNLLSPVISTADADWLFVDLYSWDELCDAGECYLQYYDNTGAWDTIIDLSSQAEGGWYHFQSGRITDSQYLHANFQVQIVKTGTAGGENMWIDLVYIYKQVAVSSPYSLEQRWLTQNVPAGSTALTLYVTANYSTGSNDDFTIGYSTVVGGPYTPVITINSATMTTYSAALPTSLSGQFYLNVIDTNTLDVTGQDTVFIDTIRIYHITNSPYDLEQRWMTQNVPSGATTLTLYVRGNYSTGSNDDFTIGYSTVVGGPYTPVITINSATMTTYSAALPTSLSGQFYLNVIDSNSGDYSGQDTVYIDLIRLESIVTIGGKYSNWTVSSDIDVEGTRVGAYQDIDEIDPPDGLLESITEVGGVTTNKTYDYNTYGVTDKLAYRKSINYMANYVWNWNFESANIWTAFTAADYVNVANDDGLTVGYSDGNAKAFAFDIKITENEANVNSLWVYVHCSKNITNGWMYFYAWDHDARAWVQLNSTGNAGDTFWNRSLPPPLGRFISDTNKTVRFGIFRYDPGGTLEDITTVDTLKLWVNSTTAYSLEQRWVTQNVPSGATTLTLYVRGNYSTGSNDNFTIGYSTIAGGSYTPVITINSATLTDYSVTLPTSLSGQFYLNVIDTNISDKSTGQANTVYIDTIRIYYTQSYGLEQRWMMQIVPAGSTTLTLYVRANYNAGSNDDFTIGYSTVVGGPYAPAITINSATMTTYSAELPTWLSGQFYLNVIDSNSGDYSGQDTVFIDLIRVEAFVNGGGKFSNWSVMLDIDVEGTKTGTCLDINEISPDGILESVTETGGVTTNNTYDFKGMFEGLTNKYGTRKWIENGTVTLTNYDMTTGTWGMCNEYDYYYLRNDDSGSVGYSSYGAHFWAFTMNITEDEASVVSLNVYTSCQKNNTTTTLSLYAWDYDAATWVQLQTTTSNLWQFWNTSLPAPVGRWINDATKSVRFALYKSDPGWTEGVAAYMETLYINYTSLRVNATTPYSLEQRWMTQSIPAPASSLTLYVTGNYSTGSDDDFSIEYSTAIGGPYTPVITINSATMTTYSAALPASLTGQFYLRVIDSNAVDKSVMDTVYIDTIRIEFAPQYTLEHRWRTQAIAPLGISMTLFVTARIDVGADDSFTFGYSTTLAGPYTPTTIVVNSNIMTTYSFEMPPSLSGQIYINVIDDNTADSGQRDTIYVDTITVQYMAYIPGTGESDIVAYNIYRADEEDGDTIWGPYEYIGSTPPMTDIYIDAGEGLDLINQAWYYVEAEDASGQVNSSGYFSKLNFAPVTSNVQANGMIPTLTISPGLQTITITADAYDDSSQFEAIPKMDYAEMYVDADPGQGLGAPLQPVDLVWDNITEAITGSLVYDFQPGIYIVYVRTAETINGTVFYGAVSNVTIECIDQPPIANANVDQTVPQHTTVMFDGSLSTDDLGIVGYWWNFTDGTPQSLPGMYANYTFDNEGVFTVTLEVRDIRGQGDTDTMTVNVTDGDPPIADAGADQNKLKGYLTTFDGTGSYDPGHDIPPDRGIVNWTWTFTYNATPETLYGSIPTYIFWTPGTYTVTLTVTDAVGMTDIDTMNVTVQDYCNIDITPAAGACGGWILISFPTKISGDPLTILVDGLDEGAGLVTWDVIQRYDVLTATWQTTATFKPTSMNTFNYVDNTMGFWLHISNFGDGNLTIVGDVPASTEVFYIDLYAGWNLIGYPCMSSQDLAAILGGSLFQIAGTEVYDPTNSNGYRTLYWDPWTPGYNLDPGVGIWILMYDYEQWVLTCP